MIVFGPVPSRRLGRSLGINNIPPKNCSYACVYCQLGRTTQMSIKRRPFYRPDILVDQVRTRVGEVIAAGETIDYLCFVPDGEPTLDLNLGREIELLRPLARISHQCSSRGRRGAVSSGVFDLRDAESYSTVRRASRGEKTPLDAVHLRPQQKIGEKCGLESRGDNYGRDYKDRHHHLRPLPTLCGRKVLSFCSGT